MQGVSAFAAIALSLIVQVICTPVWSAPLESDNELWTEAAVDLPLTRRLSVRTGSLNIADHAMRDNAIYLLENDINLALNAHWTIGSGYQYVARLRTADRKAILTENRLVQNIQFRHTTRQHLSLMARAQTEECFETWHDEVTVRERLLLRVQHAIPHTRWYGFLSDEVFLNLAAPAHSSGPGLAQNWFKAGVGKKLSDRVGLEVFYMNHFADRRNTSGNTLNHALGVFCVITPFKQPLFHRQVQRMAFHEKN